MQRGKADEVVKAGAPVATIYFARGTGIKERLGLLRIVISPEKEVIQIVVPDKDTDAVFQALVEAGKLDTAVWGSFSRPRDHGVDAGFLTRGFRPHQLGNSPSRTATAD